MKKLLIISYKFPPFNLVGSNRWKNLSKVLCDLGYEIHIITTNWNLQGSPPNFHKNLKIHIIKDPYPHNLKYIQIKWRFIHLMRQAIFKFIIDPILVGPEEDEAFKWSKNIQPYCQKLISQNNISTIIATGAPFSANLSAAQIKSMNPSIKLIQDFRDPWSQNPHSKKASSFKEQEIYSIRQSDGIISITDKLTNDFIKLSPANIKYQTIQNGYDLKLVNSINNKITPMGEKIKLTHIGNVTNGREHPLKELLKAINSDSLKNKFKLIFIGDLNKKARYIIKRSQLVDIELYPRVAQQKALELVKSSHYALQLNEPLGNNLVSTKIYEYAGLRVPTLSLNYGGEIEKLILSKNLGISVNLTCQNLENTLLKMEREHIICPNIDKMSFQYQGEVLSNFISSLQ